MLARIRSAAVLGIDAYPVDVEVDITNGLPSFSTVGLPHGAVKEGRERVSAALANAGFSFPLRRITVNLAPADIRKDGSAFDLPIALGILVASGQLPEERLRDQVVIGEVGLEGDLRPVRGALSMALAARTARYRGVLLPHANLPEASVVEGLDVCGARTLLEVCGHLCGTESIAPTRVDIPALMADPGSQRHGLRRCPEPGRGQARARGGGGRRPQHSHDRTAGCRQDHAGPAPSDDSSFDGSGGGTRDHQDPQRGGNAAGRASHCSPSARSARRITPSATPA